MFLKILRLTANKSLEGSRLGLDSDDRLVPSRCAAAAQVAPAPIPSPECRAPAGVLHSPAPADHEKNLQSIWSDLVIWPKVGGYIKALLMKSDNQKKGNRTSRKNV